MRIEVYLSEDEKNIIRKGMTILKNFCDTYDEFFCDTECPFRDVCHELDDSIHGLDYLIEKGLEKC